MTSALAAGRAAEETAKTKTVAHRLAAAESSRLSATTSKYLRPRRYPLTARNRNRFIRGISRYTRSANRLRTSVSPVRQCRLVEYAGDGEPQNAKVAVASVSATIRRIIWRGGGSSTCYPECSVICPRGNAA